MLLGKLPLISAAIYVIAEFLGALIGYGILVVSELNMILKYYYIICFDNWQVVAPYNILNTTDSGVCVTSPVAGLSPGQALLIEAITTGVLILLVCAVWDPRSGNGDCGSLKFCVIIFFTSVIVVSI